MTWRQARPIRPPNLHWEQNWKSTIPCTTQETEQGAVWTLSIQRVIMILFIWTAAIMCFRLMLKLLELTDLLCMSHPILRAWLIWTAERFPSVIRSTEILICYAMTTISMTLSFLYFCRSITANTSVTARSESRRLTMTKRRSLLNLSMNSTGCLLQWMIMKHSLRKTEMYPFMATISFIVIPSIIVPVMRWFWSSLERRKSKK